MPERTAISKGMQVVTADGELLGTVDGESKGGFMLKRMGPTADRDETTIPDMWIARVDDHVHLNRTGAEAIAGWKSLKFKTSSGDRPGVPEAMRHDTEAARPANPWLLWLVLALVAIAAVVAVLAMTGRIAF
jgi:hypothetical protein